MMIIQSYIGNLLMTYKTNLPILMIIVLPHKSGFIIFRVWTLKKMNLKQESNNLKKNPLCFNELEYTITESEIVKAIKKIK